MNLLSLFLKNKQKPLKVMLVIGMKLDWSNTAYLHYWLLTEYDNGTRKVETIDCIAVKYNQSVDFSVYPRVCAWQKGGEIAQDIVVDLTSYNNNLQIRGNE